MKVQLKNVHVYDKFSEETTAFTADLYIDGIKVGECSNNGQGGSTDYRAFTTEQYEIISKAEKYFESLPPKKYGEYEFKQSLELTIDDLLEDYLEKQSLKKFNKLMLNSIIIGDPIEKHKSTFSYFKQTKNLSEFPTNALQYFIDKIKAKHCTDGKVILNTNLTQLGINV